jgi:hypothetical protein
VKVLFWTSLPPPSLLIVYIKRVGGNREAMKAVGRKKRKITYVFI